MKLTVAQFAKIGTALYGPYWQTELAAALGHNVRTIRGWLAGRSGLPADLPQRLARLANERVAEIKKVADQLAA